MILRAKTQLTHYANICLTSANLDLNLSYLKEVILTSIPQLHLLLNHTLHWTTQIFESITVMVDYRSTAPEAYDAQWENRADVVYHFYAYQYFAPASDGLDLVNLSGMVPFKQHFLLPS